MNDLSCATVLYIHSSDEMYGSDVILLHLIEHLDLQHFRPIVVLPTDLPFDGKLSAALRARGVKVIPTNLAVLRRSYFHPFRLPLYLWRFFYSLVWLYVLIHCERVSLVHSNTLTVIPGVMAALLARKPHVWHVHEIITRPRFLWRLTAWLAGHLSTVNVAVSSPTRSHLIAGDVTNEPKTIVIHNGLDTQRFDANRGSGAQLRREWNIQTGEILVGMIGRFSHWKGQDYLLRIAAQVLEHRHAVRFAFVGGTVSGQTAVFDSFVQTVVGLGIQDRIIISGYRSDVPTVLEAYDIFVLPSILPDPLPTVVLEAMAMGKAVVANAHGGSIEMVAHGVTGFLVGPGNEEEMIAALLLLIDHPEVRQAMGNRGRLRMECNFSLDLFVEQWTMLYQGLLK
jgi:glycosyltransferase involved in cell wall biosynthesis